MRNELRALRSSRIWLLLAATALVTGGYMAAYSYISPLLTGRTGIAVGAVPLVLIGYGVGALAGTNLGGLFGDRKPLATFITTSVAAALVLLVLIPLSRHVAPTIVLVVFMGLTGMAVPPVATGLAVRFAASAPTLAAALAVSGFNGGIALGSWIAGDALGTSLGLTGPAVVGVVMIVAGLVPLVVLAAQRATESGELIESPTSEGVLI